jgi:hypothetical protein
MRVTRAVRPRFRSAIADLSAHATADPSRWTHRVGVTGRACRKFTPTRIAIGLSSPVGGWVERCLRRAKPVAFRPPPSSCRRHAFGIGGGGSHHLGLPRPLFSCPYLECQLVREIHRPRAVVFGAISSSLQQSNDVTPSFIDPRSGGLVSLVRAEWSNPIPRSGLLDTHDSSPSR